MVVDMDCGDFNDNKEFENIGLGCALEAFTESVEVLELITKLKSVSEDVKAFEVIQERFVFILDQYQEQPHLLDKHLEMMLETGIDIIRDKNVGKIVKHEAFKMVKHLMKVRGFKVVVRHLPHEVSDLEPVLQLLESQSLQDRSTWDTAYVLLLWMSIIVKIPFHMSRLDGLQGDAATSTTKTVMERVFDICKTYIHAPTLFTAPAGFLTAHFISRSDVKDVFLVDFLNFCYQMMVMGEGASVEEQETCIGTLAVLSAVIKYGKREDLVPHAPTMLQRLLHCQYKRSSNSLLRKFAMKTVQRIGLIFLKPKVATWRYQRGSRSLADNLKGVIHHEGDPEPKTVVEEDFDVPAEVEEVIDELMQGLKDSDTVIRWSAAKGVGRVTGRLPKELADEVVGTVMEFLSPLESDGAWHGGCLALAELGRRGLLLPQRLSHVVPCILKALVYEDPRGYFSIGDHVRDAACYVTWSFARAYDAHVLKPYVNQIASGLLVVTLFDREVKCRRAASAAFQENVGRQGTFPHGIDILTNADYFTVGVRQNAYLKISVFVAQFEEYTLPLVNHLVESKVDHWDAAIRELTASALHNMTSLAPSYMATTVLTQLLAKTKSSDLNCRHGAIVAVGEVVHALAELSFPLPEHVVAEVRNLVRYYKEKFYLNGMGGEILRQGICHLIRKCALARVPYHNDAVVAEWQNLMDECLLSEVAVIRSKAISALPAFFSEYYRVDGVVLLEKRDCILERYVTELASLNQTARSGFALAMGEFPAFMLRGRLREVVRALLDSLKITEHTLKWAESRRDSIKALIAVVTTVGMDALNSCEEIETSVATSVGSKTVLLPNQKGTIEAILEALLSGLAEYTNDSRGDIGAWVREAAMHGLEQMTLTVARWDEAVMDQGLLARVVGGVAQQAVERIDRTRFIAGRVFKNLLHHSDPVLYIPHRDELVRLFPKDVCEDDSVWRSEQETFPRFVKLLTYPCYTRNVMEGLVLSIGGLTERLVKYSSSSLFSHLKSIDDPAEVNRICMSVVDIFTHYQHNIRVIIPLFAFLDRLLGSGVVRHLLEDPNNTFAEHLLRLSKLEITKAKDYRKLVNSMDLFCQLVQVPGEISKKSLAQMSLFLCYKLKAVRKSAASKLYECLLLYGDCSAVPEEKLDEVMALLSDTNWEEEPPLVRPIRNQLCELMQVPIPSVIKN